MLGTTGFGPVRKEEFKIRTDSVLHFDQKHKQQELGGGSGSGDCSCGCGCCWLLLLRRLGGVNGSRCCCCSYCYSQCEHYMHYSHSD